MFTCNGVMLSTLDVCLAIYLLITRDVSRRFVKDIRWRVAFIGTTLCVAYQYGRRVYFALQTVLLSQISSVIN